MKPALRVVATAALAVLAMPAGAQQKVAAMANGTPVAPTGLSGQPLGVGPFLYRTAEQQDVKVTVVARDLEYPYSIAFLPSGELLVTERPGRLRVIRNGVLDPKPIAASPAARFSGVSGSLGAVHGYMSLVVHPRFAENRLIYFAYNKPIDAQRANVVIARARLENDTLVDVREFLAGEGLRGAVCLAMTPDGMLWIASGGDATAQDPKVLGGKVLRLRDEGTVPPDNPFVGKEGHRPEIYSMGHRSAPSRGARRAGRAVEGPSWHRRRQWPSRSGAAIPR
jgi:glucose/arabinose dehydrogenase